MTRALITSILFLIASTVVAADCGNCRGERIVGPGPVRWACPVCQGTGTAPEPIRPDTGGTNVTPETAAKPAPGASRPDSGGTFRAPGLAAPGQPRPAVARITAADGPSRIAGSGVLVESGDAGGVLLTNWHVVRSHRHGLTITWPDGSTAAGRVIAYDDAWDLAAVAVPRPVAAPVPIAVSAPRLGDRLTIAGYGPEGRYLEQTGAVTEYLSPTGSHPRQFVEIRAAARQGDSGGPMFDASGELAGVLFGQSDGRTVGSCSTRLRTFLAEAKAATASSPLVSAAQCCDGRCARR